jgi:hypothetical protein
MDAAIGSQEDLEQSDTVGSAAGTGDGQDEIMRGHIC